MSQLVFSGSSFISEISALKTTKDDGGREKKEEEEEEEERKI
jgi:hypothetical protein